MTEAMSVVGQKLAVGSSLATSVGGPAADIAADFRATVRTPGRSALGAR